MDETVGLNFEEKTGWWRFTDPRATGGHLMEMGTHMMDLVLFWTGETPEEYGGFINKKRDDMIFEDQGTLMLKFASGIIATVEVNMSVTSSNMLGEKATIFGDKGTLEVNHFNGMWFGVPFYEYIPTRLTHYGALSPLTKIGFPVPVKIGKKVYMHRLQAKYFIDKILGEDTDYFGTGSDIAATGRDGLAVMKAIDRAYGTE